MPIKEFPGTVGWGYTPRYYFAIETSYGTTMELKEMIDTFHKHGIRVIMDGVYNHVNIKDRDAIILDQGIFFEIPV